MHASTQAQVVFYDPKSGREQQSFDHSGDDGARHFACADVNPAGDAAVVGAFNRLYVFTKGGPKGAWQAAGVKQVCEQLPRAEGASHFGLHCAFAEPDCMDVVLAADFCDAKRLALA